MNIEKLYDFARKIEEGLGEFNNGETSQLSRQNVRIEMRMDKDTVLNLDNELHYVLKKMPTTGYMPSDKIDVTACGINFHIEAI